MTMILRSVALVPLLTMTLQLAAAQKEATPDFPVRKTIPAINDDGLGKAVAQQKSVTVGTANRVLKGEYGAEINEKDGRVEVVIRSRESIDGQEAGTETSKSSRMEK